MGSVLYTGGRLDSVQIIAGLPFEWNNWHDSTYSDCSLGINQGTIAQLNFTDTTYSPISIGGNHTVFFHAKQAWGDGGNRSGSAILQFLDSAGHPWIQLLTDFALQYNSGSGASPTWVTLGTTVNPGYSNAIDVDVQINISSTGTHSASLFVNRTEYVRSAPFTQVSFTNLAAVQVLNQNSASAYAWSEFIITEGISTIGAHVKTCRPTGPGNYSDWTGSYTDVNETLVNDTTANQSSIAGQKQTYTMSNVVVPAGYYIGSVFHYMRVKNDGIAPLNLKSIARIANTDFISSDLPGMSVGFTSVGMRYDNNPVTNAVWTQTDWNAPVQFGFESDT